MRIMGLRVWCHELSWFITGVVIFTFIAVTVSALLSWTFLPLADGGLLLVYMAAFTLSEVGMALLVASVFSKVSKDAINASTILNEENCTTSEQLFFTKCVLPEPVSFFLLPASTHLRTCKQQIYPCEPEYAPDGAVYEASSSISKSFRAQRGNVQNRTSAFKCCASARLPGGGVVTFSKTRHSRSNSPSHTNVFDGQHTHHPRLARYYCRMS